MSGGGLPAIEKSDPVRGAVRGSPSTQSKTPLHDAAVKLETAQTKADEDNWKGQMGATLKHYDHVAAFSDHPSLHYFASDDSFDDHSKDASEHNEKRGAMEKIILKKLQDKIDIMQSNASPREAVTSPKSQILEQPQQRQSQAGDFQS